MSTHSRSTAPATALRRWWYAIPVTLMLAAGVVANAGLDPTPNAAAANTDSVTVTATVGSTLDMADGCAGVMDIDVLMGDYADDTCSVDFGASNDPSVNLRASSSAGNFLAPAGFADESTTCADLSAADEVGLKVVSVTALETSNAWGCAVGAGMNNTTLAHKGVPDSFENVCTSLATGTANTCTLGIGVYEAGSNATANDYIGTLNLDVIG